MQPTPRISPLVIALAVLVAAGSTHGEEAPKPAPPASEQAPALAPAPAAAAAPTPAPAPPPATPAPAAESAPPAPAEVPVTAPRNRSLEYAKELVVKGKYDAALKELDTAAALPGNAPREVLELSATRAQILLLQKKPDPVAARDLIVEILHADPDATVLAAAPDAVKSVVEELRATHALVLHDRVAVTRGGRPIKLKAKVIDPKSQVTGVTLHFKGRSVSTWATEPMKRDLSGSFSGFIRNPEALAPEGVTDGYFVDYFLTAEDAAGRVIDSNGDDDRPIAMEISSTKAESSGLAQSALPPLDLTPKQPEVAPVVEAKPWYLEWYTLAGAGVVLAGTITAIAVASSGETPLPAHMMVLDLGGGQ